MQCQKTHAGRSIDYNPPTKDGWKTFNLLFMSLIRTLEGCRTRPFKNDLALILPWQCSTSKHKSIILPFSRWSHRTQDKSKITKTHQQWKIFLYAFPCLDEAMISSLNCMAYSLDVTLQSFSHAIKLHCQTSSHSQSFKFHLKHSWCKWWSTWWVASGVLICEWMFSGAWIIFLE